MDHKDLDVWKKSVNYVTEIYEATGAFPKDEIYGLTCQLRRAAVSVPSNIAEGTARSSDKETIRFMYVALGSLAEVETQIIIAEKLNYLNDDTVHQLLFDTKVLRKMLMGLVRYLKSKQNICDH
jgi:four helix bundle protein